MRSPTMEETIKTIYERRSVRSYRDQPVFRETTEKIIAAGRMAPSAMNHQPWHFYVIDNPAIIRMFSHQISEIAVEEIRHTTLKEMKKMTLSSYHLSRMMDYLKAEDHIFYDAPVLILITTPKDDNWGQIAAGMCAQNMMLAAKALGLDSCSVGFARYIMQTRDYNLLNIPPTEQVDMAVVIGYGNEEPQPHQRQTDNITYISADI